MAVSIPPKVQARRPLRSWRRVKKPERSGPRVRAASITVVASAGAETDAGLIDRQEANWWSWKPETSAGDSILHATSK